MHPFYSAFLLLLPLASAQQACGSKGKDSENVMAYFKEHYRGKHILPFENTSTEVLLELSIQDISAFNDTSGEFVLDFFFSQLWPDPDLNFSNVPYKVCRSNVTLDPDFLSIIWSPNVCLINARDSYIHASPTPNAFLILYQDALVWLNYRMQVSLPCSVDLHKFPFDSQICTVDFESYNYGNGEVTLSWFRGLDPITLIKKLALPDFDIDNENVTTTKVIVPGHENTMKDRLVVTLHFQRRYGFYILQAYVPTYLTIFVSWIAFVMEPKATAARTSLSISALLALTFQLGNILSNLPRVSYTKALDIWIMGCITFLFLCIAELTVVSFIEKNRQNQKDQNESSRSHRLGFRHRSRFERISDNPEVIDKGSLVAFPISFGLFNVVYWFWYMS